MEREIRLSSLRPENRQRDLRAFVGTFYGPLGLAFMESTQRGENPKLNSEQESQMEDEFFRRYKCRFNLRSSMDERAFYLAQTKAAEGTVHEYVSDIPILANKIDMRNEIGSYSGFPATLLRVLSIPDGNVDPTWQFELWRQTVLTLVASDITLNMGNGEARKYLNQTHQTFEGLFKGQEGAAYPIDVYSCHHPETNKVVDVCLGEPLNNIDRLCRAPLIRRYTPLTVRQVDENAFTYVTFREKSVPSAIRKAIGKAVNTKLSEEDPRRFEGIVDSKVVTDTTGFLFVPMSPDLVLPLKSKITQVLGNHPAGRPKIDPDNEVNHDRGQADVKWERLQVYINGSGTKQEVIIQTLEDFLNAKYHVGAKDESGLYRGDAHRLYRLRRVWDTAEVFFPASIYGMSGMWNRQIDIKHEIVKASERIALQLKDPDSNQVYASAA